MLRERYSTPTDTSWPQAACWGSSAGVGGAARTVHTPGRWRSIAGARGAAPSPACRFQPCHCWRHAACVLTLNISTACSQTSRSGWEFGAITLRHSKNLLGLGFRVSGNNRHALTRKKHCRCPVRSYVHSSNKFTGSCLCKNSASARAKNMRLAIAHIPWIREMPLVTLFIRSAS